MGNVSAVDPKKKREVFDRLGTTRERDKILLRRSVGKSIEDADSAALAAFYANVRCRAEDEEKAFFIACLYCEQRRNGRVTLPTAWGDYTKKNNRDGDKLLHLLDMPWNDNVARSIIKTVKFLNREGYLIDLEWLYNDIRKWDSNKTRRNWASSYSRAHSNIKEDKTNA